MNRFFKNCRSKATEDDCVAIIRRFDLDGDSKLSKKEFLAGIRAEEPFSKMIIRDKMAKREAKIATLAMSSKSNTGTSVDTRKASSRKSK